ncbi:MAG TPA: DNA-processing protein DprA [Solirubrobacteraceae bacterium]|nr:DNA-processing protein DprA [Solirubrobacteraceae bacterium]
MTLRTCDACLRRTDLLGALAARLDVEWRRRSAPSGVLSLSDDALIALDPTGAAARRHARFRPETAREQIAAAGLTATCRCSDRFPPRLLELPDPPAVLHVAGDAGALDDEAAVAVVGARRGTPYGLEVARGLGRSLSAAGATVVSGLALGVDAAAHLGALDGTGALVAVLAGGADRPYPARHRALHRRVAERGCVVSELPPGVGPHRWAFVARNRIIAGLSAMTIVVEATERSGSLTTADFAVQAGRAVGAVPGPVTSRFSAGANALIAAGAAVVRDVRDVLDVVPDAGTAAEVAAAAVGVAEPPEPELRRLLDRIERGAGTAAELAPDPEAFGRVLHGLTELELRGLVRRDFGGRYVRALGGGEGAAAR